MIVFAKHIYVSFHNRDRKDIPKKKRLMKVGSLRSGSMVTMGSPQTRPEPKSPPSSYLCRCTFPPHPCSNKHGVITSDKDDGDGDGDRIRQLDLSLLVHIDSSILRRGNATIDVGGALRS